MPETLKERAFDAHPSNTGVEAAHGALKYRPDIDGLRGVAVTSVVAYHVGLGWLRGGFIGVDVFFAISGYLIGAMVFKEIRGDRFSITAFYARRAKRILPALYVVLAFCYVAAFLLLSPHELKNFVAEALTTITSSSNILYSLFTPGYFHPNTDQKALLMTWSLGVEEQFYLIFPVLMILISRARVRLQFLVICVLALLSLAASIAGTEHHSIFTFYMLYTRAWELAAGVLLAIFESNRPQALRALPAAVVHGMSVTGLCCIGLSIALFDPHTPFPGWAALLPVSGAVLIIASQRGVVNRALSWRPIVFVGMVSYSWYLWHWPILTFSRISCATGISTGTLSLLGLASFGCAVISYLFVEQPCRRSKAPSTVLLKRYAGLAALTVLPAIGLYADQALVQKSAPLKQLDMASSNLLGDRCAVELSVAHPPLVAPCIPPGNGPAVALIGDSHATALAGALRAVAANSGFRLVELTKGACAPMEESTPLLVEKLGLSRECVEFNREALNYIVNDPSIEAVVVAEYWSLMFTPEESVRQGGNSLAMESGGSASQAERWELLEKGLDSLEHRFEAAGKSMYLVEDNPHFSFDTVKLQRTRLIAPRRLLARLLETPSRGSEGDVTPDSNTREDQMARAVLERFVSEHRNAHLIDLRKALCNSDGCRFAEGDQTLYVDDNHLSLLGAQVALAGLRLPKQGRD